MALTRDISRNRSSWSYELASSMSGDTDVQAGNGRVYDGHEGARTAPQSSDQVQESAHALIQLAQSGLGVASPISDDGSPGARSSINAKSQLTSQQIIEQEAAKRMKARRAKGLKKKQARAVGKAEAARAVAALLDSPRPNLYPYDTVDREETAAAHQSILPRPSHPLDEILTDDEIDDNQTAIQELTDPSGLPNYTISQRQKALIEAASEQTSRRSKRRKLTTGGQTVNLSSNRAEVDKNAQEKESRDAPAAVTNAGSSDLHQRPHGPSIGAGVQKEDCGIADLAIDPALNRERSSLPSNSQQPNTQYARKARRSTRKEPKHGSIEQSSVYVSPYGNEIQPPEPELQRDSHPHLEEASHLALLNGYAEGETTSNQNCFGAAEIEVIERFRDAWCQENAKQPQEFNRLIQANLRKSRDSVQLFKELQDMFPHHQPVYIQRFCRRKFHNFSARGTWTAEEEEKLRHAVAEKGTSWKSVGLMIDRFPEDCRDRWRNYLSTPERKNHDHWTDAEVRSLARCIFDCFYDKVMAHWEQVTDMSGYFPPPGPDIGPDDLDMKLINWQTVSDRMLDLGLRRTRLQCSYKWSKLRDVEQSGLLQVAQEGRVNQFSAFDADDENRTKQSGGWRSQNATKSAQKMLTGDKMDLLQAILESKARSEEAILWRALGPGWFQKRWSTGERKAGWLALKASSHCSESDDYRYVARKVLEQFPGSERDERYDFSLDPEKVNYRKRIPRRVNGMDMDNNRNQINASGGNGLGTEQDPQEVVEITSDSENDERLPPRAVDSLTTSGDLVNRNAFSTRPQTTTQVATRNGSTDNFLRIVEDDLVDMTFELSRMPELLGPGADISPSLTRRVMELQHA